MSKCKCVNGVGVDYFNKAEPCLDCLEGVTLFIKNSESEIKQLEVELADAKEKKAKMERELLAKGDIKITLTTLPEFAQVEAQELSAAEFMAVFVAHDADVYFHGVVIDACRGNEELDFYNLNELYEMCALEIKLKG